MQTQGLEQRIAAVADMIRQARRVVAFTGAGVSTESGIPDFRSPGGLWSRFDPGDFTIDKFLSSPETRRRQWRFLLAEGILSGALPNAAHRAIAALERTGKLSCVITQNIDNLHQKAGNSSERVYELHGNVQWVRCLSCEVRYALPEVLAKREGSRDVPVCGRCGGILKPDVVFFGEALPAETLYQATVQAKACDVLLVVGSSLVVYPAASLPLYAKGAGARLAIINRDRTPADGMADVVIHASAGPVMTRIMEALQETRA